MLSWFAQLDRVLRGQATHPSQLKRGQLNIPVRGLLIVLTLLGMSYGFCMGWFAILRNDPQYMQVIASMIKVPLLFLLTLLVTFPSLYVFNALIGSRLSFGVMLRLLIASQAVLLSVLASFGPIVAFFSVTSTSYHFILLLNVVVFSVAGLLGTNFLLQTLHRLTEALYLADRAPPVPVTQTPAAPSPTEPPSPEARLFETANPNVADHVDGEEAEIEEPGPLARLERPGTREKVRLVFYVWVATFAIVGGQMAWVLRPFVGNPYSPFTWFRERQSNFLEAVIENVRRLFQS